MTTPRSPYGNGLRLTNPPTLARNLVIFVMNPYLARILVRISSSSGPVTSPAVASVAVVPALTRPRASHGWTVTFDVCASRLALPEADDVQKPILPSPTGAAHTGLVTAVPSRLKVVSAMYFS